MLSSLKVVLIKPKYKFPLVLTLATERTILCNVFYVKLSKRCSLLFLGWQQ